MGFAKVSPVPGSFIVLLMIVHCFFSFLYLLLSTSPLLCFPCEVHRSEGMGKPHAWQILKQPCLVLEAEMAYLAFTSSHLLKGLPSVTTQSWHSLSILCLPSFREGVGSRKELWLWGYFVPQMLRMGSETLTVNKRDAIHELNYHPLWATLMCSNSTEIDVISKLAKFYFLFWNRVSWVSWEPVDGIHC